MLGSDDPLGPFWAGPASSGIFSDFDGTLALIVDDPSGAAPYPGTVETLVALGQRVGRVGIISGRPAAFLLGHLGGRGLHLSGLYGLETVTSGSDSVVLAPAVVPWGSVVDQVADQAEFGPGSAPAGVDVERKGFSVTIHYRRQPQVEAEAQSWAESVAAATGLRVHPARQAVELRPPVRTSKATALMEAAVGLDRVMFMGDDAADLEAFGALDTLAGAGVHTLRVAVASPEEPEGLAERADVVVEGVVGAVDLLGRLLAGF
ncbi:MAG: trehalose-phosphatase [Acidimicrobiales bacterium]